MICDRANRLCFNYFSKDNLNIMSPNIVQDIVNDRNNGYITDIAIV